MAQEQEIQPLEEDFGELVRIRREKLSELQQAGSDPFEQVTYERTCYTTDIINRFEELENTEASIAGRIMSKRDMGKASFFDIQDRFGRLQCYVRQDDLGEDDYKTFKKLDIGDIIGVSGLVFRTRRGEISLHLHAYKLLSKSLLPLPEKFHGLKDVDTRYRQRYVDLIVNPEVRSVFEKRSKIIASMRRLLDSKDFMEVETPVLSPIAGGASARPFITHHNTLDIDLYLRIATELHLKRLIIGGMERVYEIGRIFRNEGMDPKHNPEFTTIELYQAYTDYHGMMDITEELIETAALEVLGTTEISYQEQPISLKRPFCRMTMTEAVKQYSGIDFDLFETVEQAKSALKKAGIAWDEKKPLSVGDCMNLAFEETVEENLIQPTFICDYPIEVSPLTKKKPGTGGKLTERFELFITGREIANAYSELNDPIDQRERFVRQAKMRDAGDDEANMMDEDFLTAMEYGMPPTGGMGMGIDRLTMLLCDSASIRDVLFFPTMKPQGK